MTASTHSAERIRALADQCVKCSLCLPHCPTYGLDRKESESPRGRIALAAALAGGDLREHFEAADAALGHCLACRACERVCPAQVRYGELLVATRELCRELQAPVMAQRVWERLVRHPRLLRGALAVAALLRRALPESLAQRWPRLEVGTPTTGFYRPAGQPRGRVALFLGCVARGLDAAVQAASVRVLTRLGWEVVVPSVQGCCGNLHRHAGNIAAFNRLAGELRSAMSSVGAETVLVSASGCFEAVQIALSESGVRVRELSEFVTRDPAFAQLPLRPSNARVAVQVPCTQSNVVGAGDAPARLLQNIPGLQLHALSRHCCGAAGLHMWFEHARAAALRGPLLQGIIDCDADTVASSNIGCRLHLAMGDLERKRRHVHPIELLAEALP